MKDEWGRFKEKVLNVEEDASVMRKIIEGKRRKVSAW